MDRPVLAAAERYRSFGYSVIPVRCDGSKAPALPKGEVEQYRSRFANDDELHRWFGNGVARGIGVVCGPGSGNLVALDFEAADAFDKWRASIPADTVNYLESCPVVRTPSGGAHVWCRLPQAVQTQKLALRADHKTLIETRGTGAYVVAPGSPAACHATLRLYEFIATPDESVTGKIPMGVWGEWCDAARRLTEFVEDEKPRPSATPKADRGEPTDGEPGTDFNRRGTWEQTGLFTAGWTWEREQEGERGNVCRPGKAHGTSGTVGIATSAANSWPLFHCFTSNGHPFEPGQSYSRFSVFAMLNHRGDIGAAAKALRSMGFGKQEPRVTMKMRGKVIGTTDESRVPDGTPEGDDTMAELGGERFHRRHLREMPTTIADPENRRKNEV